MCHIQRTRNGRKWETEVLMASHFPSKNEVTYLKYPIAFREAHQNQPRGWNPADPPTPIAKNLFVAVKKLIGLRQSTSQQMWCADQLRMYVAVGTALDYYHGVDAFLELEGVYAIDSHLSAHVSIDITLRHDKLRKFMRNHLILDPENLEGTGMMNVPRIISMYLLGQIF